MLFITLCVQQDQYVVNSTADFLQLNLSTIENIVLAADLNFSGIDFYPQKFKGSFNGSLHTISNVLINAPESANSNLFFGLFGDLSSSVNISNLNLVNVTVVYSNYGPSFSQKIFASALVARGSAQLYNIRASNVSIFSAGNMNARNIGVLVGDSSSIIGYKIAVINATIVADHAGDGQATGFNFGGIAGRSCTFKCRTCYVAVEMKSNAEFVQILAGGLVGSTKNAEINQSQALITGEYIQMQAGGMVGQGPATLFDIRTDLLRDTKAGLISIQSNFTATDVFTTFPTSQQVNAFQNDIDLQQNCSNCITTSKAPTILTYKPFTTQQLDEMNWDNSNNSIHVQDKQPTEQNRPTFANITQKCNCGTNAECQSEIYGQIISTSCICVRSVLQDNICYPDECFVNGTLCDDCDILARQCPVIVKGSNKDWLWLIILCCVLAFLITTGSIIAYHQKKKKAQNKAKNDSTKSSPSQDSSKKDSPQLKLKDDDQKVRKLKPLDTEVKPLPLDQLKKPHAKPILNLNINNTQNSQILPEVKSPKVFHENAEGVDQLLKRKKVKKLIQDPDDIREMDRNADFSNMKVQKVTKIQQAPAPLKEVRSNHLKPINAGKAHKPVLKTMENQASIFI
ncbi:Conserved_hypothetical protein [Hexamita inflata]|uniref:Uncharacterized protein n=1 Tax=Hexamita inflata TaxID=28002 RepID=A0AA86R2P8_9EUKA|nr:Conserved hypothetical protein [Hexamita inflata]